MKILVTSPNSTVGSKLLNELLAPEFSVRVVAQDPASLPGSIRSQVEVVTGSLEDPSLLIRALDGVEALLWCSPRPSPRETDLPGHYERLARAAAAALRERRTPRVVTLSAGGKGRAQRAGPISGLHAMEDILNETGAAIRHLRCGSFMENLLGQRQGIERRGLITYPMPGHIPLPLVAADDVVDVALRWLVRSKWSGIASVAVHGPEDLSYDQAADILGQVLDRPVQFREASANQFVQGLVQEGACPEYARSLVDMFTELAQGISHAEPRTWESTTPTPLRSWAETALRPRMEFETGRADAQASCAGVCPS